MSRQERKQLRPPTPFPPLGAFRIEVTPLVKGQARVLVSACEEILVYSHEALVFRHKSTKISIAGADLWCRTYSPACAEVLGYIKEIRLSEVDKDA